MGDDGKACFREIRPRGQPAPQDEHPLFDRGFGRGGIQGGDSPRREILREGAGGFLLRPGQHEAGHVPVQHVGEIVCEQIEAARPDRKLAGGDVVEAAQGDALPRMGEGVQQDAALFLQLVHQAVGVQRVFGQAAAELPLLQQGFDVLLKLPLESPHPLLDPCKLRDEHKGVRRVIEQSGGPLKDEGDVFVEGGGAAPAAQALAVGAEHLLLRRRALALEGSGQPRRWRRASASGVS